MILHKVPQGLVKVALKLMNLLFIYFDCFSQKGIQFLISRFFISVWCLFLYVFSVAGISLMRKTITSWWGILAMLQREWRSLFSLLSDLTKWTVSKELLMSTVQYCSSVDSYCQFLCARVCVCVCAGCESARVSIFKMIQIITDKYEKKEINV